MDEPRPRDDALVLLLAFGPPHTETNPYLIQLVDALPASVEPIHFSWRRALVGRYDVFHLHWPEVKLRGRTRTRSVWRGVRMLLLLLRIRLQRKALVRTLHNEQPHEPLTFLQHRLLRLCDRWTTLWITLSPEIEPPTAAPTVVILHGHYRDWYRPSAARPEPGRLLHFGLLRRYKGTGDLVRAFTEIDDPALSLRIAGKFVDPELASEVERAAAEDPRITATNAYLSDDELADEVARCELVLLPFTRVTNSGSVLLALSLDRPVLAPSGPVVDRLAEEVGVGWVLTYPGQISAEVLRSALEAARAADRSLRPDLSARAWPLLGEAHAAAFVRARQLARRGSRRSTASRHRLRPREREDG